MTVTDIDVEATGITSCKGVDYYGYVGQAPMQIWYDATKAQAPGLQPERFLAPRMMQKGNVQICGDVASPGIGAFDWTAVSMQDSVQLRSEVNPVTGSLGGQLTDMLQTPSVFLQNTTVSYGMYDAGTGRQGLPNQHQSYSYVTRDHSSWMTEVLKMQGAKDLPLSSFALPGAHDAGISMTPGINAIVDSNLLEKNFSNKVGEAVVRTLRLLSRSTLERFIVSFFFTQKEDFRALLRVGVRFFDFRPGIPAGNIFGADRMFHMHGSIPGRGFSTFLDDVTDFLNKNPEEFVFVQLSQNGIKPDTSRPKWPEINEKIQKALVRANQGRPVSEHLTFGTANNLRTPIKDLLSWNMRLIFLTDVGAPFDTKKQDSYDAKLYATSEPSNIIKALDLVKPAPEIGATYTVLQLQGTVTAKLLGGTTDQAETIVRSIATGSDAASPLLATKAKFDHQTYSWVQRNGAKFTADVPLVLLNDFADCALVDIAKDLTIRRMGLR
ncbi:MAG: hypothetical protein AAF557_15155 [Pseudomonadota bacterium]